MSSPLLDAAMRELARRHIAHLNALGPVRVFALDSCVRCGGRVIASDTEARCVAGCGWRHKATPEDPVPLASRRADV